VFVSKGIPHPPELVLEALVRREQREPITAIARQLDLPVGAVTYIARREAVAVLDRFVGPKA
jgi:hypothetical protein